MASGRRSGLRRFLWLLTLQRARDWGLQPAFDVSLYQAQGSLSEAEYYIHLAKNLGYIEPETVRVLSSHRSEAGRTLQGLIKAVDDQIASRRSEA